MGAPWRAGALNADCLCSDLDRARLAQALDGELAPGQGEPGLAARCAAQPTLFADAPVFLPAHSVAQMHALAAAMESVIALPAWREAALAEAGLHAHAAALAGGPAGVCMGYDFHVDAAGQPSLIEINTNAGGLLLNAALAHAGAPCCAAMDALLPPANPPGAIHLRRRAAGAGRPPVSWPDHQFSPPPAAALPACG